MARDQTSREHLNRMESARYTLEDESQDGDVYKRLWV